MEGNPLSNFIMAKFKVREVKELDDDGVVVVLSVVDTFQP